MQLNIPPALNSVHTNGVTSRQLRSLIKEKKKKKRGCFIVAKCEYNVLRVLATAASKDVQKYIYIYIYKIILLLFIAKAS